MQIAKVKVGYLVQHCLYMKPSSAFTLSEVAADWQELTISQRIMRLSISFTLANCSSKQ